MVVVGAGLAGLRACETLRHEGFDGHLKLVGDELHLPYDRPPLSKQFLAGSWDESRCRLRTPAELEALEIELDLGSRARSLDLATRSVALADGRALAFDGLVIATGASPRPLAGITGRPGVMSLRTMDDARTMRAVISRGGARLVIAGAGFIGLEVAATARGLGAEVTVVEPLALPLERAVGPAMGTVFEAIHRDHGVDIRLGTTIESLRTGTSNRSGLRCALSDGKAVEADAVLVAVGVAPATSWLDGSGLELGPGGLRCDPSLSAGPAVVAAGDLVRWRHPVTGESMRIEHRTNAAEQGEHAARSLLAGDGSRRGFAPVPYFWSDQYDCKIQVIGSPHASDETVVVNGSPEERRFVALFCRAGRLSGVLAFSRPRALMAYRGLLERAASMEEALALKVA